MSMEHCRVALGATDRNGRRADINQRRKILNFLKTPLQVFMTL